MRSLWRRVQGGERPGGPAGDAVAPPHGGRHGAHDASAQPPPATLDRRGPDDGPGAVHQGARPAVGAGADGPSVAAPAPGGAVVVPLREDVPRLGFVGAGRAGTALAVAFRRAGWPVSAVASRDPARRDRFVELVPGSRAFVEPGAILDDVDLVVVAVPDDAIAAVASALRLYSGQAIMHLSGLLPASVLAPALAAGTEAGSFHPLVAFAGLDAALAAIPGATVAIEGDEALMPLLRDLAQAVGMRPVVLPAAAKPAHHAAAVLAAGGVVALLDAVVELAAAAGMDAATALDAYVPLARQSLRNAETLGVASALTGPVVRGDAGTLAAHIDALRRLAPDALPLYIALAARAVAVAARRGELAPGRTEQLLALLASSA